MSLVTYNWRNFPDFKFSDCKAHTLHVPVDRGYDIRATQIHERRREAALGRANGILSGLDVRRRVRFFALSYEVDIGLSGSTAQGRRTRDFYPHNIVMPMYKITGAMLNQEDYALLCEFVHESHHDAVSNGNPIQLDILAGGLMRKPRSMRGAHRPVVAQGFIESITREHKVGVYAPVFTFSMAVIESLDGIFTGISFENPAAKSILDYVTEQEHPFSQAPKPTVKSNPSKTR